MLLLAQNPGESVYILDEDREILVKVAYVKLKGNQIRLGFEAAPHITILREKLLDKEKIGNYKKKGKKKEVNGNVKEEKEVIFFMDD